MTAETTNLIVLSIILLFGLAVSFTLEKFRVRTQRQRVIQSTDLRTTGWRVIKYALATFVASSLILLVHGILNQDFKLEAFLFGILPCFLGPLLFSLMTFSLIFFFLRRIMLLPVQNQGNRSDISEK